MLLIHSLAVRCQDARVHLCELQQGLPASQMLPELASVVWQSPHQGTGGLVQGVALVQLRGRPYCVHKSVSPASAAPRWRSERLEVALQPAGSC